MQWGDEGKGKVIDYLSENCDAVARFGGGANAGHTIVVDNQKFILKLLPSGALREGKICFIGSGVACDLWALKDEVEELEKKGISVSGRLFVDFGAHIVLPLHKAADGFQESSRGNGAIDTTKRGIGPSYADRASRIGLRICDLFDNESLPRKIDYIFSKHQACLDQISDVSLRDQNKLMADLKKVVDFIRPLAADVGPKIMELISSGKRVLFEGAQGTLLDIDMGTYPFVTSSHTTIGGIFTGLGIPPSHLGEIIGVTKAYMTRVGHGPFVSEITGDIAEDLRESGGEYGSVTGRPRRIGWLDLVALKRAIKANGIEKLAITKLDVLDKFNEIYVCEAYEINGERYEDFPPNHVDFSKASPVFIKLDGWAESTAGVRKLDLLHQKARAYIDYISEKTGVPAWLISTGSAREDTIIVDV